MILFIFISQLSHQGIERDLRIYTQSKLWDKTKENNIQVALKSWLFYPLILSFLEEEWRQGQGGQRERERENKDIVLER